MARQRTDAHRPAEMVPGNYRYLASSYYEGEDDNGAPVLAWDGTEEWEAIGRPMLSTCEHARKNRCDHCGAKHLYATVLLYIPTGEILSVGQTCAVERFGRPEWKHVIADGSRRAELKAERERNIAAALAVMDELTQTAYEWATTDENANPIAQDIAQKVTRFGPLSEKQAAFLVKLHAETQEKVRQIEAGEVALCPSGKVAITGEIKSAKAIKTDFGCQVKILVQADEGFRVWGTAASAILNVARSAFYADESGTGRTVPDYLKGLRVRFTATVDPKQDDPTFGFFTRPTKAAVLEEAVPA